MAKSFNHDLLYTETIHYASSGVYNCPSPHTPTQLVLTKRKGTAFLQSLCITGGSGEIRTRDQRIKRSRGSSKPLINQWPQGSKNDCAIECAIAYWCKVRICGPDFDRLILNRVRLILTRATKKHYNQLRAVLSFTRVEL